MDGECYGFLDNEAARSFIADPLALRTALLDTVRSFSEAIPLLMLQTAFATFEDTESGRGLGSAGGVATKCDGGTQTEMHPVERHIDPKYESNEWELRRKALKLADLRQKKTHSTQTDRSNYRRENATQVYLPK